MKDEITQKLSRLYRHFDKPYALSSPRKLYAVAKSYGITLKNCIDFLASQDA